MGSGSRVPGELKSTCSAAEATAARARHRKTSDEIMVGDERGHDPREGQSGIKPEGVVSLKVGSQVQSSQAAKQPRQLARKCANMGAARLESPLSLGGGGGAFCLALLARHTCTMSRPLCCTNATEDVSETERNRNRTQKREGRFNECVSQMRTRRDASHWRAVEGIDGGRSRARGQMQFLRRVG